MVSLKPSQIVHAKFKHRGTMLYAKGGKVTGDFFHSGVLVSSKLDGAAHDLALVLPFGSDKVGWVYINGIEDD